LALENPTASAEFEPANLGTKGEHPTSRPPKPLFFKRLHLAITTWLLLSRFIEKHTVKKKSEFFSSVFF
jgi:hypothetical protein